MASEEENVSRNRNPSGGGEDLMLRPSSVVECLLSLAKKENTGVHSVMINTLYDFPLKDVEVLLPQVLHTAVTHSCGSEDCVGHLKKFLVHLAAESLYLGVRLCWLLESCACQYDAVEPCRGRVLGLKESIKYAASTHSTSAESVPEETVERAELIEKQLSFFRQLTKISGKLASMPEKSARKADLRSQLQEVNETLKKGEVMFPLASSSDPLKWIVRLVPSECVVFSSRERAPYLLIAETVTDSSRTFADPCVATKKTDTTSSRESRKGVENRREEEDEGEEENEEKELLGLEAAEELFRNVTEKGSGSSIGLLSVVFGESSTERVERLRGQSPYGHEPGWTLEALVIKAGDDLRQEEFALQAIGYMQAIWRDAGVTSLAWPYSAIATDPSSGLIQCVTDSLSFDSVKKSAQVQSIAQFFHRAYGGEGTAPFDIAQRNFIESMAAYSVLCYLFQIKDRHNGNLLLSRTGRIIHIDFGFMLATSPGGINFESAPFKLSMELVEVMGGVNSRQFNYFRILLYEAFRTVRARAEEILALLELMIPHSQLPCFGSDPKAILSQLETRFKLRLSEVQLAAEIKQMIDISADNWRTRRYDQFQTWQNGII